MSLETSDARGKRGCLFLVKRGLKWGGIVLITLLLAGFAYQRIATELDKGRYSPRGQLYTVNGHQMHLLCVGDGSPAVILQSGGLAESLWWYWVQRQLATHTQVCAFDRPGMGWSEPVDGSRDALTINAELHALLESANIPAPYVMAGHSLGAMWTRAYAGAYPQEIVGIVLVDSAAAAADAPFAGESAFEEWKSIRVPLQAFPWLGYRVGLERLLAPGWFEDWGYPPELVQEMAWLQSPNRVFDVNYAEQIPGMWGTINAAAAVQDLGDLPTAILWAGQGSMVSEAMRPIREELATLSSNYVILMIEGADHGSILGSEQYAQQVSDAILDVIDAAQSGNPLTP